MSDFQKNFWWRLKLEAPLHLEESLIWKCERDCIKTFAIEYQKKNKTKFIFWVWLPSSEWNYQERVKFYSSLEPLAETFQINLSPPIWEKVNDEDWSSSWKRLWQPDPVGNSLLILPAWLNLPNDFANRIVLKLDPGSAFGTGSHQTTRLCLEALERIDLNDLRVADIGCGSGILSLAALGLGAKEVFAVDIDSMAVSSAKKNVSLNNLSEKRIRVSIGSVDELHKQLQGVKVDLIICNILAPVIKSLAPSFSDVTSGKAHAFLSGLLVDQIQDIVSLLAENGWQFIAAHQQEKWALIHLYKGSFKKP